MVIDPKIAWLLFGVFLIVLEFFAPGVILVFFGVGAIVTSLTTWLGLTPETSEQTVVFGISSVVLLFGLRHFVKKWFVGHTHHGGGNHDDDFTGREARVLISLPGDNQDGRVEIKGAQWNARSHTPVPAGSIVIIERREGLTFYVRPRA
jgi:membrane protein implicated in regulation of membrane protease activity